MLLMRNIFFKFVIHGSSGRVCLHTHLTHNSNVKKGLCLVILSALLLTSCGTKGQKQDQSTTEISTGSQEESQTEEKIQTEAETAVKVTEQQPLFAKLTRCDTKPETNGSTLQYGALCITLPDGVTAEEQTAENDMCVIDLNGAESVKSGEGYGKSGAFAPRVWFANYHAEYDNYMELISALLELLPDATLCERYISAADSQFFYTYDKQYETGYKYEIGYILIRGNDVYLVEEMRCESDYGFGSLLDEKSVQWDDGTAYFDPRFGYAYQTYSKIEIQSGMPFLVSQTVVEDRMRGVFLYQDGYFTSPCSHIVYGKWHMEPEFEDCNFDGCLDMVVSGQKIYLWNAEEQEYEAAQIPDDFPDLGGASNYFPETKTVWSKNTDFIEDTEGKFSWWEFDRTEALWKWEGISLVKQRECVAEVREEGVQIRAYECRSDNTLFDKKFTNVEWEKNSDSVQKQYRQFYAGMLPEVNDGYLHKIDYVQEHEEYIPQTLLDKIKNAMLDKTELETLKALVNDKELTNDEILAIAKDNPQMRCDVIRAEDFTMVLTDGDNDGIMDIVAEEYFGGTGGFTEYAFYQGQEDGSFQKTSSYDAVKQEFAMISYEGKNYLCRTLYDYDKKMYNGFGLACYVDGVQVQTATLTLVPAQYDVKLAACAEEQYRAYAEEIRKDSLAFKDLIDVRKCIEGGSEEKSDSEEYQYQCDLNNDGVAEQYNKSIWEPSNMVTWQCLIFSGEGEVPQKINNMLWTVEGTPIMMWVEPFAGENIINVISLTGLHDFEITGFLVNGSRDKEIYRITAEVTYGVDIEPFTQMLPRI